MEKNYKVRKIIQPQKGKRKIYFEYKNIHLYQAFFKQKLKKNCKSYYFFIYIKWFYGDFNNEDLMNCKKFVNLK